MNTEPINPFQSPRAEDAPRPRINYWRPDWRNVLIGLAALPFLWAGLLTAIIVPLNYGLNPSRWGMARGMYSNYLFVMAMLTLVIGLPSSVAAWNRYRLTPRVVLGAGWFVAVALGLIVVVMAVFLMFDQPLGSRREWSDPEHLRLLIGIVASMSLVFAPFGLFALYLAILRKRDDSA